MKNLNWILLIMGLLFFQVSNAQPINYSSAYYHTNIASSIAVDTSGQWIVIGSSGAHGVEPYWAQSYQEISELFDYSVLIEDFGVEIVHMSNIAYDELLNVYYFGIGKEGCDFALGDQLVSFNNAGDVFTVSDLGLNALSIYQLAVVPGEGVLIIEKKHDWEKKVSYFNGNEIVELIVEQDEIVYNGLSHWFDDHYIGVSESELSVVVFSLMWQSLEVEQSISIENIQDVKALSDSTLLILQYDGLQLRNSELEVIQELPFDQASHFTVDEQYVYVVSENGIHFLNHNLVEQGVVALDEVDNYTILDVAARNGQIGLAGASKDVSSSYNDYSYIQQATSSFIKTYTIDGAGIPSQTDVSVGEITYGSASFQDEFEPGCMTVEVSDIGVEIHNLGESTLDDVILTYTNEGCGSFICSVWVSWYKSFYDLNLAPGESTFLNIDELRAGYIPSNNRFDLCIRAAAIEGTLDKDLSNNTVCETVELVGIQELLLEADFSLYPSVCNDHFILSMSEERDHFTNASIYDLFGQKIKTIPLSNTETNITVDVNSLSTGTYFLRLEGIGHSQAKAFIKQ